MNLKSIRVASLLDLHIQSTHPLIQVRIRVITKPLIGDHSSLNQKVCFVRVIIYLRYLIAT